MSNKYGKRGARASGWRAVSVSIFQDDLFRGNDEIVAWLLIVCRYARSLPDADRGLSRGQFDCSVGELARRFQAAVDRDPLRAADPPRWTKARVRAFLKRAEAHGALTLQTMGKGSNRTTRFTVCNYDKWQPERHQNRATEQRPSNDRAATEQRPSAPNDINGLGAATTEQRPSNDRAATEQRPHRETLLRDTEKETPTAPSADPGGSGGEGKTKPKKGDTPSVPSAGGWPGLPTNAKATGFEYPAEFLEIWNYWRKAAKMNPEVKRQAVGKWNAYRRILEWLNDGLTAAEIAAATRDYLRPFCVDRKKTHCKMPATIYSRANPILPDLCDDSEATGGSVNLRPWSNPISAFVEVNRAAKRLGLPLPTFRKFSATWEQIESMPAEVLEEARRNA